MAEQEEAILTTKYLILKLSKEINLGKLLKKLKAYQTTHGTNPTWNDLVDILVSVEIFQKQMEIGQFLETL